MTTGNNRGAARDTATGPRVVALGGGHGVSASLSALRLITDHLTAVVTVADDGEKASVVYTNSSTIEETLIWG